jgi:hypothetical protein
MANKKDPLDDSNQPEPQAPAAPPLNSKAATKQRKKKSEVSYERARTRLIQRYGYKEDELKVQFPSESALLEFYHKIVRDGLSKPDAEVEKEAGWEDDDDFDLSQDEKDQLAREKDVVALADLANHDQSSIKPDARVTPEEQLAANKDLNDLLKEEI